MSDLFRMKCRKCGFVFKGNNSVCPHCGEPIDADAKFLDRQFNFFNWFYISNRNLITIMSFNAFLLFFVIEIVLNTSGQITTHIYPWVFAGLFLLEHFIFNFADEKNNFPFLFIVGSLFTLLLFLSYKSELIFGQFTYAQFVFGISTPIFLLINVLLCPIHYIKFRTFNVLNVFFNATSVAIVGSIMFGLSFLPAFNFNSNPTLRMFTNVTFVVTLFLALQLLMFCVLKIRSSYNRELK